MTTPLDQLTNDNKKELEAMYAQLKRHLKGMSKNELIRLIGATLVDNYVMKKELERLNAPQTPNPVQEETASVEAKQVQE